MQPSQARCAASRCSHCFSKPGGIPPQPLRRMARTGAIREARKGLTVKLLKPLRQSGKDGPPRAELRCTDPHPGAVADLVFLVEQIDDVQAQLHPVENSG